MKNINNFIFEGKAVGFSFTENAVVKIEIDDGLIIEAYFFDKVAEKLEKAINEKVADSIRIVGRLELYNNKVIYKAEFFELVRW